MHTTSSSKRRSSTRATTSITTASASKFDDDWDKKYHQLQTYYSKKGNSNPPDSRRNNELASWVKEQRDARRTGKLSEDHMTKLHQLEGWTWDDCVDTAEWQDMFAKLKQFRNKNGHTKAPLTTKLGIWCQKQRVKLRQQDMQDDRRILLEELGFDYQRKSTTTGASDAAGCDDKQQRLWDRMFSQLSHFYKDQGHFVVPAAKHKRNPLHHWVQNQRQAYKAGKLLPSRQEKLQSIHFLWTEAAALEHLQAWDSSYEKLVEFQSDHGHTFVQRDDDIELWRWTEKNDWKHRRGTLAKKRYDRLDALGFWDPPPENLSERGETTTTQSDVAFVVTGSSGSSSDEEEGDNDKSKAVKKHKKKKKSSTKKKWSGRTKPGVYSDDEMDEEDESEDEDVSEDEDDVSDDEDDADADYSEAEAESSEDEHDDDDSDDEEVVRVMATRRRKSALRTRTKHHNMILQDDTDDDHDEEEEDEEEEEVQVATLKPASNRRSLGESDDEEEEEEPVKRRTTRRRRSTMKDDNHDEDEEEEPARKKAARKKTATKRKAARGRIMEDSEDEEEDEITSKPPAKRRPSRSRGTKDTGNETDAEAEKPGVNRKVSRSLSEEESEAEMESKKPVTARRRPSRTPNGKGGTKGKGKPDEPESPAPKRKLAQTTSRRNSTQPERKEVHVNDDREPPAKRRRSLRGSNCKRNIDDKDEHVEEEERAVEVDEDPSEDPAFATRYQVGTKVMKFFDSHGWFQGEIISIYEENTYKVRYEDEDEETYLIPDEQEGLDQIVANQGMLRYRIGTAVKKFFEGYGWFEGKIVSIEKDRFNVRYDDGDKEDYLFNDDEMRQLDEIVSSASAQ